MFNNNTLTVVQDLNIIPNVNQTTVAVITQFPLKNAPSNVYFAGILMPPTELLMEWADGNQAILVSEYPKYLMTKDCDDMIIAIIAAITQNNVILYIPPEEFNIFGQLLLNHLYYMYGVVCNTPTTNFSIMPEKIPLLVVKFYLLDLMQPLVFLDTYPSNYNIPDAVIQKLADELKPFPYPATFDQYREYFNNTIRDKSSIEKKTMFRVVK